MDAPDCDREALREALDTLADANRYLGGRRFLLRRVRRLLADQDPGPIRILDVGCGCGDLAIGLAEHLRGLGWEPRLILGDLHHTTLCLARERWPADRSATDSFVRLNGTRLPFADDLADLTVCTLTLHHLETDDARQLLAELARVSRLGWVVTDLRRSTAGYRAMQLLGQTLWRTREIPRVDGPISVQRSFTPAEVAALVRDAGVTGARVDAGAFRLAILCRS